MADVIKTGVRPLSEMLDTGLLWFLNRSCLHPLGFALGLELDDEGQVCGWELWGNGDEPWHFPTTVDDEKFVKVMALMDEVRAPKE